MGICIFCKRELGIRVNECEHYDPVKDIHIGPNGEVSRNVAIKPKNVDFKFGVKLTLKKKLEDGK